jgi:hypothetical protein
MVPVGDPSCTKEAYRPRRDDGACSIASRAAPVHSPPAEIPCSRRRNARISGAATPIVSYEGSNPMQPVDRPISVTVPISAARRP